MSNLTPQYDLRLVQKIVRKGNVDLSESVQEDVVKYGYTDDDIYECILLLKDNNFLEVKEYPDDVAGSLLYDVYLKKVVLNNKHYDELYIKFRVSSGRFLFITSFHPEGC